MKAIGFPVQFPTTPGVMPPVSLAQPQQQGWTPARRTKPVMAQRMSRPVPSSLSGRMGQSEAELWARGSDITFSILTGAAAIASGLGIVIELGKGEGGGGSRTVVIPASGGRPSSQRTVVAPGGGRGVKPAWIIFGSVIALLGIGNIWSSINRAAALNIASNSTGTRT